MITMHRLLRTWTTAVDRYIALTRFSRGQFIAGGLPSDKITVKPNFVDSDPGLGEHKGGFALYVGRLDEEKGLHVLLKAWSLLGGGAQLRIAGDGPLRALIEDASQADRAIIYEGHCDANRVRLLMQDAAILIVPSLWDEHSPMSLLEALASGLPVVVSGHGALAEILGTSGIGWKFPPGDPAALAETVQTALSDSRSLAIRSGAARREYLNHYSAQANLALLMEIYRCVSTNSGRAA
jgi:glycosyltransferase involved in cell wall biosynthesis